MGYYIKPSPRYASEEKPMSDIDSIASLGDMSLSINEVMTELAAEYDGTVMVAEDLLSIEIGPNISVIPYHHGGRPEGKV